MTSLLRGGGIFQKIYAMVSVIAVHLQRLCLPQLAKAKNNLKTTLCKGMEGFFVSELTWGSCGNAQEQHYW